MGLLTEVRRQYPYIAFLVTTGVDDVEVGVQAMRSGADDYLVKPLQENAILASLEKALYGRRLEQEVARYRQHLEEIVAERTAQLQAALQQIETSYEGTLRALGAAIDLRDNQTAGALPEGLSLLHRDCSGNGLVGQTSGSTSKRSLSA